MTIFDDPRIAALCETERWLKDNPDGDVHIDLGCLTLDRVDGVVTMTGKPIQNPFTYGKAE